QVVHDFDHVLRVEGEPDGFRQAYSRGLGLLTVGARFASLLLRHFGENLVEIRRLDRVPNLGARMSMLPFNILELASCRNPLDGARDVVHVPTCAKVAHLESGGPTIARAHSLVGQRRKWIKAVEMPLNSTDG